MTGSAGPPGPNSAGMVQEPPSATHMMVQTNANQPVPQLSNNQNAQMMQKLMGQWAAPMGSNLSGMNYTITTTGDSPSWQKEYEVSRIVKRAKDGYFFVITVDRTDDVFYRVWKGGWFPYWVAKTFKKFTRDINGNKASWTSVTKRSHLPATLGSAYEMIEEAITDDMEDRDHDVYVRDLLTTKPENLKMIGSLEKLAEGDVVIKDDDPAISANVTSPWIAGSGVASSGNMISFAPNPSQAGTITGVSTMEAKNIILNGTDIVETIDEKLREVTAIMEERLEAMKEDKDELAKAP